MIDVVRRGKLLTAELNEWACQVDTPTDVIEILLNEKIIIIMEINLCGEIKSSVQRNRKFFITQNLA